MELSEWNVFSLENEFAKSSVIIKSEDDLGEVTYEEFEKDFWARIKIKIFWFFLFFFYEHARVLMKDDKSDLSRECWALKFLDKLLGEVWRYD